ncbi:PAS domain-containing protein [Palleronia sp. LCG004]|uniref:PAS domain-containing protein n=1 Tax=Palleronia sp. LCG004 TaxID=3079304 RepID=UPI002942C4F7|nr:PAS domain-containing protein [Palleronia sp. LCG004]WOI57382.1 PAS domain-containing protein [Palleronia sp. LCG004]
MSDTPPRDRQSQINFRDAPQRFRDQHPDDKFVGASGVLFEQAMSQTRMAICLADPNADDQPIVFVNRAFTHLTGYEEHEVIGKNCRFLQGNNTDSSKVALVSDAIKKEEVVVVELLNYRKDGTPFWNALHLGPIYDETGKLLYYFGSQWDVSDVHAARADEQHAKALARELSHRIKNMFAVIGGLVTVTGRAKNFREEAAEINDRIRALGRAFETTLDEASLGSIELGDSIRSVLAPYDAEGTRIRFEGENFRVDPNIVSTVGLALHELATNAIKYGALNGPEGEVTVRWARDAETEGLDLNWIETGGPAVVQPEEEKGSGMGIIDNLLSFVGGNLERTWDPKGFSARIEIPSLR